MSEYKIHLLVCGGTTCKSHASHTIAENLKNEIRQQGLDDVAQVVTTVCFGLC
jgi:NADH:ubiquinone oxidoreductase subunit E